MSQYKGKLYAFDSGVDGRRIDEVEVLRGVVDHLAQRLAEVVEDPGEFCASYPVESLARNIRDLCDMIELREDEREEEEKQEARS